MGRHDRHVHGIAWLQIERAAMSAIFLAPQQVAMSKALVKAFMRLARGDFLVRLWKNRHRLGAAQLQQDIMLGVEV